MASPSSTLPAAGPVASPPWSCPTSALRSSKLSRRAEKNSGGRRGRSNGIAARKSVVLDLKTQDGRENARELARLSDVVVESFRPGVTRRLGIDYDTLRAGHPELVYATLTSFGPRGPYANYKGYDAVVAAKSGRMMMFAGQNPREGPQLRRGSGRLPRRRHGADSWHHSRSLRSGKDRPGPAGGDQHAEGRDHLRSRLLDSWPDG